MNARLDLTDAAELLAASRRHTLDLIEHVPTADLERVLSEPMSPLVWDLAHIASYEDLWLNHRHGGLPLLYPELAAMYDAFETPRAVRAELPLLGDAEARGYLEQVRSRSLAVLHSHGPGDDGLVELVACHELQHTETMRQAMALGGVLPAGEPPAGGAWQQLCDGDEWIHVPAGSFEQGTPGDGFAYDNERPVHSVALPAFQIARRPVTNADWLGFMDGGGYKSPDLWSADGWAWKEQHAIAGHEGASSGPALSPVSLLSWFEADAFARFAECRLPTESEWERAAGTGLPEATGEVWEWTSSCFHPYPGFRPYPYPEYSEVFFGDDYRVLRGGSWATASEVKSITFRNWDLPQRRQLFAGLRLANDAIEPDR